MARILIADDDEMVRNWVAAVLISAGHEVLTACNGFEAVALYRSNPNRIDVVVTDLLMPVMDGYQEIQLIRESRPDAAIICMSGYTPSDLPANTVFLQKPFSPQALRVQIDTLLSSPDHTMGGRKK